MTALPSTLDAVTVYREGALCRRVVTLQPGPDRSIQLGGLPLSLEPGSLRAKVISGNGKVVDVRAQFDVQLVDEIDLPGEVKAVEAAQEKLQQLELKLRRVEAELSELASLRPSFLEPKRGDPPRPAPIDAMLALGELRDAEQAPRLAARRELNEAIADARREVTLHQRRIQEASTSQRAERARVWRVALVTLATAPTEPLELSLEYRVPGARWVPSYALTMEKGLTAGALQMRASVVQQTGEDWAGVKLSLSTASSQRSVEMPELKSLRLGRHQEAPPRSGWRAPPPGLDSLFEAYDATTPVASPPPQPVLGSAVFRQEKKADLPSPAMAMPAPPPMPMPAGAPMPRRAPSGELAAVSAGAPPREVLRSLSAPKSARGGFGGARSRAAAPPADAFEDDMPMMAEEAEAAPDMMDEGGDGLGYDAPATPESALSSAFGDYAKLTMPGPDAAPASRGRLTDASVWAGVFVGVSVQVDVVMALVSTAQRAAREAQLASLPSLTNPVSSVKAFDYRYECHARVDVPSTGKWTLVPVMNCAVGLTPEYVCVPSVEPKVYRTLTVSNRSLHALLPGPVDVTAGDEFLMTTSLPAISPGADQSHRLGLGVEEALKVSRKTHFKETTGGFLGGSTVLPHDVEIELNNRLPGAALIEVRERVPIVDGDEKDLKIEEAAVNPAWEVVDGPVDDLIVKGMRRWRLTLPAGQTQKLTASFVIRMPSDKMIVGGNRRS